MRNRIARQNEISSQSKILPRLTFPPAELFKSDLSKQYYSYSTCSILSLKCIRYCIKRRLVFTYPFSTLQLDQQFAIVFTRTRRIHEFKFVSHLSQFFHQFRETTPKTPFFPSSLTRLTRFLHCKTNSLISDVSRKQNKKKVNINI